MPSPACGLQYDPRRAAIHIVAGRSSAGVMGATPVADVYHAVISMVIAVPPRRVALHIEGRSPRRRGSNATFSRHAGADETPEVDPNGTWNAATWRSAGRAHTCHSRNRWQTNDGFEGLPPAGRGTIP